MFCHRRCGMVIEHIWVERTDVGDATLLGSGEIGVETTVGVHGIGDAKAGDGQGHVGQHFGRDSQG